MCRLRVPPYAAHAAPRDAHLVEITVTQTETATAQRHDHGIPRVGRLMRTVAIIGVGLGVIAMTIGLWLLQDLDSILGRSLALTSESLTTVDSSLQVASDSVAVVNDGLDDAEQTSRGLEGSLEEGADLLRETARLTRNDVARSLESLERSMPALIEVGGTIDRTLRAVDQLPVNTRYDPDEPFDESLQALRNELDGLPDDLREQADAIDAAGDNLRTVGGRSVEIADSIREVRTSLTEAERVLGEYKANAGQAREILEQTQSNLGRRLWVMRALVIALGLVYCAGQLLAIHLGTRLAGMFTRSAPKAESVLERELVHR
jgi:hypothetical protein